MGFRSRALLEQINGLAERIEAIADKIEAGNLELYRQLDSAGDDLEDIVEVCEDWLQNDGEAADEDE